MPAIQRVWSWIQGTLFPLLETLWAWLGETIPVVLQTLSDFWQDVLLPAITMVWEFIINDVVPLLEVLWELLEVAGGLAIEGLVYFWEEKLLPSLTLIWDTTAVTGTHVILKDVDDGPNDEGRELIVVFGDSKTYTVDVRVQAYEVIAQNGNIQTAVVDLLPTGAGNWT